MTTSRSQRVLMAVLGAVLTAGCAVAEQPDAFTARGGFAETGSFVGARGDGPAPSFPADDDAAAPVSSTSAGGGTTPVPAPPPPGSPAAPRPGARPAPAGPTASTNPVAGGPSRTPAPSPQAPPPPGPSNAGPDNSDVGVTADTIKIGAILPLSGPIGPYGRPWLEALQTPFRLANDNGGINGRRFEFIFCDDAFSGERGLACAKKLVDGDKVFIVMADGSAAGSQGALPYLLERQIPVGNSVGLNPDDFESPLVFPIGASGPNQARLMARFTGRDLRAKTAGMIVLDDIEAAAESGQAFRAAAAEHGVSIVREARINFQDADCSPQMVQMQTSGPETVFLALDAATVIKCFAAANNLGYKPPKQFSSFVYTYIDLIPKYGGAAAQGHYTMSLNHTPDTTNNAFITEYLQRTKSYYPSHAWWSQTPGFYGGALLTVDAIRSLGRNVTRARYLDAMNRVTNGLPGLGVDVTFRPGPHNPTAQAIVLQIQNGRFVPVTPFLREDSP
ncbi:MAG: ABC transporter substrate-binding protein [Actinomycetota bacterium]